MHHNLKPYIILKVNLRRIFYTLLKFVQDAKRIIQEKIAHIVPTEGNMLPSSFLVSKSSIKG